MKLRIASLAFLVLAPAALAPTGGAIVPDLQILGNCDPFTADAGTGCDAGDSCASAGPTFVLTPGVTFVTDGRLFPPSDVDDHFAVPIPRVLLGNRIVVSMSVLQNALGLEADLRVRDADCDVVATSVQQGSERVVTFAASGPGPYDIEVFEDTGGAVGLVLDLLSAQRAGCDPMCLHYLLDVVPGN